MKKLFILLAASVICFACGGSNKSENNKEAQAIADKINERVAVEGITEAIASVRGNDIVLTEEIDESAAEMSVNGIIAKINAGGDERAKFFVDGMARGMSDEDMEIFKSMRKNKSNLIFHLIGKQSGKEGELVIRYDLLPESNSANKELARRLPSPPVDEQNAQKKDQNINKRNLMVIKINSKNQLMVNGEKTELNQLRAEVKKFILNPYDDPNLPVLVEEEFDFGSPVGKKMVRYPKDHIISVQNDVDTQYQAYLEVQDELVAAYNEVRDNCARQYYKKAYVELEEAQQKVIQKIYPQKISEAEPKNYN